MCDWNSYGGGGDATLYLANMCHTSHMANTEYHINAVKQLTCTNYKWRIAS